MILEVIKRKSDKWTPRWDTNDKNALFEVEKMLDRYIMNLVKRSCSCRFWDLIDIPCYHSMVAIA